MVQYRKLAQRAVSVVAIAAALSLSAAAVASAEMRTPVQDKDTGKMIRGTHGFCTANLIKKQKEFPRVKFTCQKDGGDYQLYANTH